MITVTGSLAFDHIMDYSGRFADNIMPDKIHKINLSFLLSDLKKQNGGTAGNIAYTLALLKTPVSISANIAEGSGATSLKDKLNFLDIAIKSALETTSEIHIAFILNYLNEQTKEKIYSQAEVIIKRVRAFKKFLQNHQPSTINYKQ